MTGRLQAGRPSGDDKRECARNRLHIYQVYCSNCSARHWFALPLDAADELVREEHRRWREQMRADCFQGQHKGVEKAARPSA